MASSKKSTTSKTARVMNLLSKSREEPPVVEQPSAPVPAPAASETEGTSVQPAAEAVTPVTPAPAPVSPPPVHNTHTTPLISSMQADSVISNQVMSALESALDEELGTAQQEVPAPVPTAAPVPPAQEAVTETVAPVVEEVLEPTPVVETPAAEPETEPAPVPEAIPEPVVEAAPEPPQEESPHKAPPTATVEYASGSGDKNAPATQVEVDPGATYVNVMETLVEEKANKYIDLFGLCKCQRCVADVKAYALNHLSPKYVVMRTGEVIPRITLYENQFSAVVTAQILNACKIVMASPRHDS